MFRPSSKELLLLKGGGGESFMHFVDDLIQGEAYAGGLPLSEVVTQQRGNIGDGGVDTRVRRAVPGDKSGYLACATCWQYKAETAEELLKKRVKGKPLHFLTQEADKPAVQELVAEGHAFRFCMLGDLPPIKVKEWEAHLWAELRQVNPATPEPRVLTGVDLARWSWRFPAVAARVRSAAVPSRLLHFEKWADKERVRTPRYVPVDRWKAAAGQVLAHADFSQRPIDVCLPIQGEAGVGKTRLVLETLDDAAAAAGALVLYTDDERTAVDVATELVRDDSGSSAIVVADECQVEGVAKINDLTRACIDRLRFICISNTGDRLQSPGPQVWLEEMERAALGSVLAANFPAVPPDRRSHYAELAGGFVRLAAFCCQNDARLVGQGDLSLAMVEANSYVWRLLSDERDREVLELLALFTRVGVAADVAGELASACDAVGQDPKEVFRRARRLKDSPGFVAQAGRYLYVTPAIVARAAFGRGWNRWVADDPQPFAARLALNLVAPFHDAVRQYGSEEVRTKMAGTFRTWVLGLTDDDLADPDQVRLLARTVETDPERYLLVLRRIVEAASAGGGLTTSPRYGWTPRRDLVWLVESLAAFPELYEHCEAIAYLLALHESEPTLSNNATGVWAHFHSVFLSGSSLPFARRFAILERRAHAASTVAEVLLCLKALSAALSDNSVHTLGSPTVAGRLRPSSWKPASDAEHLECWRSATKLLVQWALGADAERANGARRVLVDHLPSLLAVDLLEQVRPALKADRLEPERLAEVVDTIKRFLSRLDRNGRDGDGQRTAQANRIRAEVQGWMDELRPTTLDGRMRELLSRSPWSPEVIGPHGRPTEAVTSLARDILDGGTPALVPVLPFLVSGRAAAAGAFGVALGLADVTESLLPSVFDAFTPGASSLLMCGYVAGAAQRQGGLSDRLRDRVDSVGCLDATAGLAVRLQSPVALEAYRFAIEVVDAGRLSPAVLATFAYPWAGSGVDATRQREVVSRLAAAVAASNDEPVRRAFLRLLVDLGQGEPSELAHGSPLVDPATRDLARKALERTVPDARADGYEMAEALRHLAAFDAGEAIRLLFVIVTAKGYGSVYDHSMNVLQQLAATQAVRVMALLGSALTDPKEYALRLGEGSTMLLATLPVQVVADWVNGHGVAAAEAVAHELPLPFVDADGRAIVPAVTRQLLTEHGSNEGVCDAFVRGAFRSDSWWGSEVSHYEAKAAVAKRFLNDESRCIRKWAEIEVGRCEQMATSARVREGEERLF